MIEETQDSVNEIKESKLKKNLKEMVPIILLVLAFRSVFFEPFKIPSGSMIPTLHVGDFILVNKFSYGFKVPFSDYYSDPTYITGPEMPKRGDVVVFKYPEDTSFNFIKRVIGLPGDIVEVIDKVVYINDQPIEMKPIDGKKIIEEMDQKEKDFNWKFFETLTGEHKHVVQIDEDSWAVPNYSRRKVPEGHFFVMGDNRDKSSDSRFWGFVPFGHIKGKAILIWFSLDFPWPWEKNKEFVMKPWRIGNMIE